MGVSYIKRTHPHYKYNNDGKYSMNNKLLQSIVLSSAFVIAPAYSWDNGDFIIRMDMANISDSNDNNSITNMEAFGISNASTSVEGDTKVAISMNYMISDDIGLQFLGSFPFKHKIQGADGLDDVTIATTKHIPSIFTAQWHFMNSNNRFQAYVGAGFNYTVFFSGHVDSQIEDTLGNIAKIPRNNMSLTVNDSLGVVGEAGIDFKITDNIIINATAMYVDISTDGNIRSSKLGTKHKFDINIDPWLMMVGVGYRF